MLLHVVFCALLGVAVGVSPPGPCMATSWSVPTSSSGDCTYEGSPTKTHWSCDWDTNSAYYHNYFDCNPFVSSPGNYGSYFANLPNEMFGMMQNTIALLNQCNDPYASDLRASSWYDIPYVCPEMATSWDWYTAIYGSSHSLSVSDASCRDMRDRFCGAITEPQTGPPSTPSTPSTTSVPTPRRPRYPWQTTQPPAIHLSTTSPPYRYPYRTTQYPYGPYTTKIHHIFTRPVYPWRTSPHFPFTRITTVAPKSSVTKQHGADENEKDDELSEWVIIVLSAIAVVGFLAFSALLFYLIYKMYKVYLYKRCSSAENNASARYETGGNDEVTMSVPDHQEVVKAPPTPPPAYDKGNEKKAIEITDSMF